MPQNLRQSAAIFRDAAIVPAESRFAEPNVSVLVLTYNEENDIGRCLSALRFSNDVVVLDSLSTDRTVEIAESFPNVRVETRPFDDYAGQRNHGLREISYRNAWVLIVDADEVVEPDLVEEIRMIARDCEVGHDLFLLRRKVYMGDRWLKHNVSNDFWIGRLVRPLRVRYEGVVHERLVFEGSYGTLAGCLEHHQFSKGVDHWWGRRAQYAKLEADQSVAKRPVADVLSKNTLDRRAALKILFRRLPARGAIYFLYNFLVKAAFLDGWRGLKYIYLEARSQSLRGAGGSKR